MKRYLSAALCLFLLLALLGCAKEDGIKNTIAGNLKTYYEMTDGTWRCGDISYAHRLELRGRLSQAECDTVYVYLSNVPISFDQAWKASGLSSSKADYFSESEAVLVEIHSETKS